MTYEYFEKLLDKMLEEERAVGKTKAKEYTLKDDRLDNFKRLAIEMHLTPKQILWVYLKKHLDSILNYIWKEAIDDKMILSESIEGRIMDARVYLSLLRGLIEEDKSPELRK